MAEKKIEKESQDAPAQNSNIEQILRERNRIDQLIQEKFKKEITILFTDICGYTQYMDTMADINGMTMLQRHNDVVIPIIESTDGVVIKKIGDAVMASFADPVKAVAAAVQIQKSLEALNRAQADSEKIHVKIGLNTGDALVGDNDIFGDAVNVASRIQSQAGKDIILISKTLYDKVATHEDFICRHHGLVNVKGKAKPLELYRVVWKPEQTLTGEGPCRAPEQFDKLRGTTGFGVVQLDITQDKDQLKIGAWEQAAGETSTVRPYETVSVTLDLIETRCKEIIDTLNRANKQGKLAKEALLKLREVGQILRDELFTARIKDVLKNSSTDHLMLSLDESLVYIPWELLHDGKTFLCQQFSMGRLVKTRRTVESSGERKLEKPLKMMILSDPKGDLKGAYKEGTQIRDLMDQDMDWVNATMRSEGITTEYVKEKIRTFDIVHFAGHSDHDRMDPGQSGWRLSNGRLKAVEIEKMIGTGAMPAFIFSNACQSARSGDLQIDQKSQNDVFGLANAFILSGVKHYLGTFWEILDEPGRYFALEFYGQLFSGHTIGQALRMARTRLIEKFGEESIVWASYILYGDPCFNYAEQIENHTIEELKGSSPMAFSASDARAKEDVIDFSSSQKSKKGKTRIIAAAAAVLVIVSSFFFYHNWESKKTLALEQTASRAFSAGDFQAALDACGRIKLKHPENHIANLIQADIYLRQNHLPKAAEAYETVLAGGKETVRQKARALVGLGRVASLENKTDVSLNYYQKATQADDSYEAGFLSQAILLEKQGQAKAALEVLAKASQAGPVSVALQALAKDIQQRVELIENKEKQKQIDGLVKDLIARMQTHSERSVGDGWTSRPLSLWVKDFEVQGIPPGEGDPKLLMSAVQDRLIQQDRIQVVERALLDSILKELKLGTSQLADQRTALTLGKILAARLILFSRIMYQGADVIVSMRLIETQTGRVTAAYTQEFKSTVSFGKMSSNLCTALIEKILDGYPLKGKVSEVSDQKVTINIGKSLGVSAAARFEDQYGRTGFKIVAVNENFSIAAVEKGNPEQVYPGLMLIQKTGNN